MPTQSKPRPKPPSKLRSWSSAARRGDAAALSDMLADGQQPGALNSEGHHACASLIEKALISPSGPPCKKNAPTVRL